MLSNFWQSVKQNKTDLWWIITLILVGLSGFGIGGLIDLSNSTSPIIINCPQADLKSAVEQQEKTEPLPKTKSELVGSVNSDKYHHPDCFWAKRIAPENQIWFDSEQEARQAGYSACGNLQKYLSND